MTDIYLWLYTAAASFGVVMFYYFFYYVLGNDNYRPLKQQEGLFHEGDQILGAEENQKYQNVKTGRSSHNCCHLDNVLIVLRHKRVTCALCAFPGKYRVEYYSVRRHETPSQAMVASLTLWARKLAATGREVRALINDYHAALRFNTRDVDEYCFRRSLQNNFGFWADVQLAGNYILIDVSQGYFIMVIGITVSYSSLTWRICWRRPRRSALN